MTNLPDLSETPLCEMRLQPRTEVRKSPAKGVTAGACECLRRAEVAHFDVGVVCQKQVFRLDVSVAYLLLR